MKTIWIVQYNTGYTSEGFTEAFKEEVDARLRYVKLFNDYVIPAVENAGLTVAELLNNEELSEENDIYINENEASFDGPEVFERISIFELEIN